MNWRVFPLLILVTLIAGGTPIAAYAATTELPPLTVAAVRFMLAGLCLGITARVLGQKLTIRPEHRNRLLLLAALCVPINQIGFLVGVKYGGAAHAGIAYALVPVLVFWISVLVKQATVSTRMVCASSLAFAGAAIVVWTTRGDAGSADIATSTIFGDLLLLSAGVTWALFSVLSKPLLPQMGAVPLLTVVFLLGSAMHLPVVLADYLWFDLRTFDLSTVSGEAVGAFLYITIITAYLNYLLWYTIISRFDVTKSSIITNCSFLVTVGLENLLGKLVLSYWILLGSLLLLAGIILANLRGRSEPRP
ncbi:MAG: DMT family transporter [Planctomycetota bacterium]|jgi:drug/metabolite transporter (DMT)-like permease